MANSQSIKDRIHDLQPTDETFQLPKSWNAMEFFDDFFGIIADQRIKPEPTFDFIQEILRNGEDMEVLEPLWLRLDIVGIVKRIWNKYKEDN